MVGIFASPNSSEFTVDASGNTDIDGTLNVEGVPTFQAGAVFSAGVTTAGAIAGATTVSGSGQFSMSHIDLDGTLTAGGIISGSGFLDVGHEKLRIGGAAVTAVAAELNLLDGVSGLVQSDFTKLAAVNASAAEINLLDSGAGSSVALATGDGLLMFDATDSNDAKKVLMSDVGTLLGSGDGITVSSGVLTVHYAEDVFYLCLIHISTPTSPRLV